MGITEMRRTSAGQAPVVSLLGICTRSVYIYHIHLPLFPAYIPAVGPLDFGGQGGRPARPPSPQGRACIREGNVPRSFSISRFISWDKF